jgi:pyruvate formate lyase activating enzyme
MQAVPRAIAGKQPVPLVVEIRRHSLEDGPGVRSVVFFKGCPLHCSFCQNPETQALRPELAVVPARCLQCGLCIAACSAGALDPRSQGIVDRARCDACGACAEVCPTGALRRIGVAYTPEALAEVLLRDRHFYRHTGGGITLSGGEPTLFPGYLEELLRLVKAEGVHVSLETCGYFTDYEAVRDHVLPYVDRIDVGLKLADSAAHRAVTGKSNRLILDNLRRLAREPRIQVEASIPLVPGITATRDNLAGLIELLREAGISSVRLLPYNPLGVHMVAALGRPPPAAPDSFMPVDEYARIRRMFEDLVAHADGGPDARSRSAVVERELHAAHLDPA